MCLHLHFREENRDGRWESEREGRRDKVGCLLLPATVSAPAGWFCPVIKGEVFPNQLNSHELHSALPPSWLSLSPSLSLHLTITPYLPPSLPSGLGLPVWMSPLCFVTCTCLQAVFATWAVLQRNGIHLSLFLLVYTLPATCRFILQQLNFTLLFFLTTAANILEIESLLIALQQLRARI